MKVEVLYFDGCPTYETATKTLRKVLSEEGLESDIEFVAVNTDEQARRLRFPGSPTIRVDGEDLFPVPDRAVYALGCQTYPTPEGPKGSPGAAMLTQALSRTFGNPSSDCHRRRSGLLLLLAKVKGQGSGAVRASTTLRLARARR